MKSWQSCPSWVFKSCKYLFSLSGSFPPGFHPRICFSEVPSPLAPSTLTSAHVGSFCIAFYVFWWLGILLGGQREKKSISLYKMRTSLTRTGIWWNGDEYWWEITHTKSGELVLVGLNFSVGSPSPVLTAGCVTEVYLGIYEIKCPH